MEAAFNLKSISYEIFPELKGVRYLSYNYLFQSLHTLDLILNLCTTKAQVVNAFTMDSLERFKPIIEILVILLTSKHREADDQTLKMTTERIKSFFTAVKRKVSLHQSIQQQSTQEQQISAFAGAIIEYLNSYTLEELSEGTVPVICYTMFETNNHPNRMFEVPWTISYVDL